MPAKGRDEISGHRGHIGKSAGNRELFEAYAKGVMKYLTIRGAAADRLEAKGYGDDEPVAGNGTARARANNRRMKFVPK